MNLSNNASSILQKHRTIKPWIRQLERVASNRIHSAGDGFGPNRSGPSGLRMAGADGVRPLGRGPASTVATFLVDRRAKRQTE